MKAKITGTLAIIAIAVIGVFVFVFSSGWGGGWRGMQLENEQGPP